jgi:hypothetical protein
VFVNEEYRMKGIFRRLLNKNEDFVMENPGFKKIVKLYMDKDNAKAEKVYFKVGFKVCKKILYELDFHFDDISEIKKVKTELIEKEINIKILGVESVKNDNTNNHLTNDGIFPDNFYHYIVDVDKNENSEVYKIFGDNIQNDNNSEFESLINFNTIDIKNEKHKIMKVIKNRNLGAVLLITNVN